MMIEGWIAVFGILVCFFLIAIGMIRWMDEIRRK
jgi:hypothetical protein